MDSLSDILLKINDDLEVESELREKIKDSIKILDKHSRQITSLVNRIHSTPQAGLIPLAEEVNSQLIQSRPMIAEITDLIPANQYFKWAPLYNRPLQALIFAAALAELVLHQKLIEINKVAELIGIDPSKTDRVSLLPDDYLHGVISMVNELSRLAINSVTLQNYTYPLVISAFVSELFAGYQLLNLKNDSLRRRFDSLKYDLKSIEQVVYDISLRGLTVNVPATTSS
ncbi:Translin [Mrakia frigida]|uniref:translin n=1 Tax=Mrakia frigida TaxID=29902 RepID=UPI003FCC224F